MLSLIAVTLALAAPPACDPEAAGCRAPSPPLETGPAVKAYDRALKRAATVRRLRTGRLGARFDAPTPGTLRVRWADGRAAIATARHRFSTTGSARVRLHLTRHGRAVLRGGTRGLNTHTEFRLPNGTIPAGSSIDGEVTVR